MCADQTNPKDLMGVKKAPLSRVPPALIIEVAPAMDDGARKYGAYNWREKDVKASIYYEAALRHLMAWYDREERAPDSGHKHLAHVGACIAIILDAEANGNLIDDRPLAGPAARLLAAQDRTGAPAPESASEPTQAEFRAETPPRPTSCGTGHCGGECERQQRDWDARYSAPTDEGSWDMGGEG